MSTALAQGGLPAPHRAATADERALARAEVRGQAAGLYVLIALCVAMGVWLTFVLGREGVAFALASVGATGTLLAVVWFIGRRSLTARVTDEVIALEGPLSRVEVAMGGGPHTHAVGSAGRHLVLVPRPWFPYAEALSPTRVEGVRVAVRGGADTVVCTGLAPLAALGRAPGIVHHTQLSPEARAFLLAESRAGRSPGLDTFAARFPKDVAPAEAPPVRGLSVARERAASGATPLTQGRWVFLAGSAASVSYALGLVFALFAWAGGYGEADPVLASRLVAWAGGSAALCAGLAVPLMQARRRMYAMYAAPGIPSAADFSRARRRALGGAVLVGPALMLLPAALGLAPLWAAVLVGLVAFVPAAVFIPVDPRWGQRDDPASGASASGASASGASGR